MISKKGLGTGFVVTAVALIIFAVVMLGGGARILLASGGEALQLVTSCDDDTKSVDARVKDIQDLQSIEYYERLLEKDTENRYCLKNRYAEVDQRKYSELVKDPLIEAHLYLADEAVSVQDEAFCITIRKNLEFLWKTDYKLDTYEDDFDTALKKVKEVCKLSDNGLDAVIKLKQAQIQELIQKDQVSPGTASATTIGEFVQANKLLADLALRQIRNIPSDLSAEDKIALQQQIYDDTVTELTENMNELSSNVNSGNNLLKASYAGGYAEIASSIAQLHASMKAPDATTKIDTLHRDLVSTYKGLEVQAGAGISPATLAASQQQICNSVLEIEAYFQSLGQGTISSECSA